MNKNLEIYGKYGFVEDDELFSQIFSAAILKKVHIDVCLSRPYMLLSRTTENNVTVSGENDDYIVITKKDKYKTVILDLLLDEISDIVVKKGANGEYEMIFTVCGNIKYKISFEI